MIIPQLAFDPIGLVRSPIREAADDVWGGVISSIELDGSRFSSDCVAGLDAFSHVEIVFLFHQVPDSEICIAARRPRGRADWPMIGIFAQRGRNRPNRIGVTICRLVSVKNLSVEVESLDAVDGTPVIDIKPYMREFAAKEPVHQPAWTTELMTDYWKPAVSLKTECNPD